LSWSIRVAVIIAAGAVLFDAARPPSGRRPLVSLSPAFRRTGACCRLSPRAAARSAASPDVQPLRGGGHRARRDRAGGWLALKRIVRCGPWTPAGTKDSP